ncbi:MAG: hypothetical protein ACP5RX_02780 [Minisyncoccia bacterium]
MSVGDFENFLEKFNNNTENIKKIGELIKNKGSDIEEDVTKIMQTFSKHLGYDIKFEFTGSNSFPDVLVKDNSKILFGVELKTSKSEVIPGNSIMEDCSIGHDRLFIIIFEYDKEYNVRPIWGHYFEAVQTIKITHSPRYYISSTILKNRTGGMFSSKSSEEIDKMRKDKNKLLVEAYNSSGTHSFPEWFTSFFDDDQKSTFSLKQIKKGDSEIRSSLIAESFVWCPILFSNQNKKYKFVEKLLILRGYYPPANLRDWFSAGGQEDKCQHVLKTFEESANEISKIFRGEFKDEKSLREFWEEQITGVVETSDLKNDWKKIVLKFFDFDKITNNCKTKLDSILNSI